MKRNEKKNLRIDLLNLEKLSVESMGESLGANDPLCDCVDKGGEVGIVTFAEYIQNIPH